MFLETSFPTNWTSFCICLSLFFFPELPVKISKPLVDVSVTQKDKVTFECELSRPNADVKWFKVQHVMGSGISISDFSGNESL